MTPANIAVSSDCVALISQCVDSYEKQMSSGSYPDLRTFVQAVDDSQRPTVLAELVKVDLERRWRDRSPRMLEEYFRDYPELGDAATPALDLIQEEYRVRCRWGDAPVRDVYCRRFKIEKSQLLAALEQVEQSLGIEAPSTDAFSHDPAATVSYPAVAEPPEANRAAAPPTEADSRRAKTTAADMPLTIGRYRVEREVGSGAFGRVYRCRDDELKRTVAIKLPHGNDASSAARAERIIHEARSAARLRHDGVVMVLDTIRCDDGRIAIVSEFVEGQTLRQLIRQHDYTRAEALGWVADLADALAHAHRQQVVHRDVKPDNVLIDAQRHPHLTDFGLAKLDEQIGRGERGMILGTLAYMSPEQANGQSHWASPAADIYSLGVVLYELLCGKLPFTAAKQTELLDQIRHRPPPPLRASDDSISPELEAICLKSLAKEPGERFTSAADLARALHGLSRPKKSRRPIAVAAAALALAVLAACVFAFLHRPKSGADVAANGSNKAGAATAAAESAPKLEIRFQRAAEKVGHHRLESADLPLAKGDKVQLHAKLAKPGYLYVYWCDGQGKPQRLWPADPAHVEPVAELWDPPKTDSQWQTWHVLGGPPAAEMALLAVSDTPIPPVELAQFEAKSCRLPPADAAHGALLSVVYPESADAEIPRSLDGTAVTLSDPLPTEFQAALRAKFRAYFGLLVTHE